MCGCPVQLSSFSDSVKMAQGNWHTVNGMLASARGSLQHAHLVTSAMHAATILLLELFQLSYSLPSAAPPRSPVL